MALRDLAVRASSSKDELRALERDCVSLTLHIQRNTGLHDVPKVVWHFLSDADTRFKSPDYAATQLEHLRQMLAEWAAAASGTSLERARGW